MKSFFQRKQTRAQPSSKSSSDHKFSLPASQISPETHRQTPAPSTYDGKQKAYEVPSHSSSKKDSYSSSTYKVPTQPNSPAINVPQWMPPTTSSHTRRDDDRARESGRSDKHRHRHRDRGAETDVEKVASRDTPDRRDKEKRREPSRHRDTEHDSRSRHYYSETERDLYRKPDKENLRTQHRDRRNESLPRRGPYDEGDSSDDSRRKPHKSSNHRRHRTTDAVFVTDYDSKFVPFTTSSEKPGREDLPVHLPVKSVKMQSLENEDPHGSASETERIRHRETRRRHKDTTSQFPEHRPSTTATKAHYSTRQPKTGSESRAASSRAADIHPSDRKKSTTASESTGQPYTQAVPSSGLTGPVPSAYQLPYSHALQESAPQSGVATSSSMSSYHTALSISRQGAQGTPPTTSSESPASMRKNQSSFPSSDPALHHQPADGRTSRNLPVVSTPGAGSQRDAHRQHLPSSADSHTPQPTLNPSSPNKVPSLISKFESLSATVTPSVMVTPASPRPPSTIGFKQSLDRGTLAPPMFASVSQQKTSQQSDAYHRTDAYTSPTPKASENATSAGINSSSQATIGHSGSRSTNIIGSKHNADREDPPPTGYTSSQPSHSVPRLNSTDQARIIISNASQPQTLSHEALAPSIRQTSSAMSHSNDGDLSLANDYRTYAASGPSTKREIPHPWAPSSGSESRDLAQPSNVAPHISAPFATSGHQVKNQSLAPAQTQSSQINTTQTSHAATSVTKVSQPKGVESKWTSASSTVEAQHHGPMSPNTHPSTPAAPKITQGQSNLIEAKAHARHDSTSVPTASRSGTEYEKTTGNPQRDNNMFKVPQKALFQHPKLAEIMSSSPTTPVSTDNLAALPSRPSYEGRASFEDQLRSPQAHQHLASFHHDRDGMSPVYASASKQAAERAELSRPPTAAKPPSPALHHRQSKSHWHTPPSPGAVQTPSSTPSSRHSPASVSRPYDFRTGHGGSPSLHNASSRESYNSARIYTPPNADSSSARVQSPEAQAAPIQASPLQPSYYRAQSYEGQTAPPPTQAAFSTWRHDESIPRTHRTASFTSTQPQPQTSGRHAKTQDKYVRPDEPIGKTNPHPSAIDLTTSYQSSGTAKHSVSIGSTAVSDIKPRSFRNPPHYPSQQNPHPSPPPKLSQKTSQESILLTPSSLAPSMLKPTVSRSSIPASVSSQNESKKKSGFLGIFRGKQPPAVDPYEIWYPPEMNSGAAPSASQPDAKLSSRVKVPRAIAIPSSNQPISERKSPNKAVFTPFRYLTSRRNRTVSAASVEALHGTAPNTVVGSPTASMHSQNPMQPPLRDPLVATQEWRDEMDARPGGKKIQRPGVVFDVKEEPSEDKQRLKPVRSRQSGASGLISRPG